MNRSDWLTLGTLALGLSGFPLCIAAIFVVQDHEMLATGMVALAFVNRELAIWITNRRLGHA